MKYAGIIKNDIAAAPGVCLTFFVQGCPHHCKGCHNPETWDFDGGKEFNDEVMKEIISGINANGIMRDLCIMGGEPLCEENAFLTEMIIREVKNAYPELDVYIWTGYLYEDLKKSSNPHIRYSVNNAACIIDGPYVESLRDVTLPMRGSSNQKIHYKFDWI